MFKSILITHPELAKEWDYKKNKLDINKITYGSSKYKIYWICKNKHSWVASPKERTRKKWPKKCRECSSLSFKFPKIAKEWHPTKNGKLTPVDVSYASNKRTWWLCPKYNHSYRTIIATRTTQHTNCPVCAKIFLTDQNRLSIRFPEIAKEWHPTKNGKLTPADVSYAQGKKVWWLCKKCEYSFFQRIAHRTSKGKKGCPACSGKVVSDLNRLSIKFPKLIKEWHPTKNGKLTPADVSFGSNKKVWWICKKQHVWKASINNRSSGDGCSKCNPASSKLEIRIYSEIKKLLPTATWREKIKSQEIDIFIKELNLGIEVDGSRWHINKYLKDLNKNRILSKEKVRLIRLREKPLKLLSKK